MSGVAELPGWAAVPVALLLLLGAGLGLTGSIGLLRLRSFYERVHAPTLATTLGIGCILLASILHRSIHGSGLHPREILITVFLFITAPISAHLMAKAALSLMMESRPEPPKE